MVGVERRATVAPPADAYDWIECLPFVQSLMAPVEASMRTRSPVPARSVVMTMVRLSGVHDGRAPRFARGDELSPPAPLSTSPVFLFVRVFGADPVAVSTT